MSLKLSRYCADTAEDTSWNRKLLDVLLKSDIRVSNSDFLPRTCTFGSRDWSSVSARSCRVWWCGPCARRCWSSPGEPSGWAWRCSSWSCPSCQSRRCSRAPSPPRWNMINIKRWLLLHCDCIHCFVFILGSFKSLPTSVISSLIQLNVQAVFNSGRRGPDQRNSAMSGIEFQENSFAKFFRLGKSQGQLFTFIEGFR